MATLERDVSGSLVQVWPALPQAAWGETCATLQLWMQIVGKVRLALFERTKLGDLYMSDLDGVLLAVSERKAA